MEFLNLCKHFGTNTALNDVTVQFNPGSVIGLIGLNGSGKTTLLRHIMGLLCPDSGECRTFGKIASQLDNDDLARIGCVHQDQRLLEWMTIEQHLKYISRFYPHWDLGLQSRLLREFELEAKARVGSLSPGNIQKLSVICACCHRPELLIMDEPASSMDPISRKAFFAFLFDLLEREDQTVVISSHILTDIEKVVDQVVCLHQGSLILDQPLDSLRESYAEWTFPSRAASAPLDGSYIISRHDGPSSTRLYVKLTEQSRLEYEQLAVKPVSRRMNLEEIFPLLIEACH